MTGEPVPAARDSTKKEDPAKRSARRILQIAPLVLFVLLAGLLLARLGAGDPSQLPSALIGRQAPTFSLPPLSGLTGRDGAAIPGLAQTDLAKGDITVVNVWAAWCAPCRIEHPLLMRLAKMTDIRLVGINYKDDADNARRFLNELGNPFAAIGVDAGGRAAIDWGVYGVPETFIVDGGGRIVYKHIGPLTEQSLLERFLPQIEKVSTTP